MKNMPFARQALRLGLVVILVGAAASDGPSQDPTLEPQYGTINLQVGFDPDPTVINLLAGGKSKIEIGGFKHFVDTKPDVRLNYAASAKYKPGQYPLTIYADCDSDATLLIRLPDGKWIANDNGPNTGKNPVLKFLKGQAPAGTYDIWVGTVAEGNTPPARLFITELKP